MNKFKHTDREQTNHFNCGKIKYYKILSFLLYFLVTPRSLVGCDEEKISLTTIFTSSTRASVYSRIGILYIKEHTIN